MLWENQPDSDWFGGIVPETAVFVKPRTLLFQRFLLYILMVMGQEKRKGTRPFYRGCGWNRI